MKPKLASYQKYPLYAAEQFFQLLDHVRGDLPEVTQPILIMHAKNDHSVAFSNSTIIFDEIGSTEKWKIDLEESYHIVTVDVEQELVKQEMLNFIKTHSKILQRKPVKAAKPAKKKVR
jgi:carboxylesterase